MTKSSSLASMNPATPLILEAEGWEDYRLLDSGEGQKLEEVGGFRFIRPEAAAVWGAEFTARSMGGTSWHVRLKRKQR